VVVGDGGGAAAGGRSLVVGMVASHVAAAPASIDVGGKACGEAVAPDAAAAAYRVELLAPLLESRDIVRLSHFLSHVAEETPSCHLHLQDTETDP
jgi:hypothetical protein